MIETSFSCLSRNLAFGFPGFVFLCRRSLSVLILFLNEMDIHLFSDINVYIGVACLLLIMYICVYMYANPV